MPRRKNAYLSDGSDSEASLSGGSGDDYNSQEDDDSRAERRLFEHKVKRRKTGGRGGKESAWEGIFGEDEQEGRGGRGLGAGARGQKRSSSRSDWTKAPAFVSSGPKQGEQESTLENEGNRHLAKEEVGLDGDSGNDDDDNDEESSESEINTTRPPSPRIRDEEDDEPRSRTGMGFGFKNGFARAGEVPASSQEAPKAGGRGGIGSASRGRGGIGSASRMAKADSPSSETAREPLHGGLGSATAPVNPIDEPVSSVKVPSAFGRPPPSLTTNSAPSRVQRSFTGRPTAVSTAPRIDLTATERAHFANIGSSFGARMLAKQGWEAGKGLGAQEDGRAVPIEVGKVFKGQGIQKGMRTEDSKREARRKGETFSDEEEDRPKRGHRDRRPKQPKQSKEDADQGWKRQKKVKVKVQHKTYEQLLAEAGDAAAPSGVGLVLDARGGELKEVQSLSSLSLSTWTPTSDATKLPELRHNLRLIVDVSKADVEGLAREGKSVNERRRWALREEQISRNKVEEAERRVTRLKRVQEILRIVSSEATRQSVSSEPSLTPLAESFNTLLHDYKDEYANYLLDDVVVGAIGQIMRRAFSEWQPFDVSSDILLSSLKVWRQAYKLPRNDDDDISALTINGDERKYANNHQNGNGERPMTAWESLLWTLWVPKVRSAINNEWNPAAPHAAVHLLESWEPILPAFIRDNVLDQLVLPKVKTAIDLWDPRKNRDSKYPQSLASIVFPWLPLLGERVEEIMDGAKRRIRSVLRNWVVKDGVLEELARWKKDVYSSSEWDKLIIQYILPKLGVSLRDDFSVNPRKQDMVPLEEWIMPWHQLLRASMFSHLLEVEFFPKWLNILYIWLIQPAFKPDEVANWFVWWKGRFPSEVLDMRGIEHGFNSGLRLMDEAIRLGKEAPSKLRKPVFEPLPPSKKSSSSKSSKASRKTDNVGIAAAAAAALAPEITFRSIAEDFAAQRDLIFLPLGRSHATTGKPLFKVSKGVDGRGLTVYIGDNAIFALMEDGAYRALSLEDMVVRALK